MLEHAKEDEPILMEGVPGIWHDQAVGIGEGGCGFLKRDPMFAEIGCGLLRIPFEGKGHEASVG